MNTSFAFTIRLSSLSCLGCDDDDVDVDDAALSLAAFFLKCSSAGLKPFFCCICFIFYGFYHHLNPINTNNMQGLESLI